MNPILLRHSESPIELLHEIFREECYRVPDGLANKLPRTPRILDVGANVGAFSAFAFEVWPDAKIMAIEPDQANLAELEKFAALRPENTIEIVAAAASTSSEPVHFASGLGSGSKISDEGDEVAAVDLLPLLKEFDLMKLDIEGGEWPILADHRMSDAGPLVIVMEYHRRAPGDMGALVAAKDLLTSAGFAVGYEQPNYWGHGLLWAWTK